MRRSEQIFLRSQKAREKRTGEAFPRTDANEGTSPAELSPSPVGGETEREESSETLTTSQDAEDLCDVAVDATVVARSPPPSSSSSFARECC
jgi:hypothetical protein